MDHQTFCLLSPATGGSSVLVLALQLVAKGSSSYQMPNPSCLLWKISVVIFRSLVSKRLGGQVLNLKQNIREEAGLLK